MPWMMYPNGFGTTGNFYGFLPLIAPLVLIEIVLKGIALWKAGTHKQLYWFIALLVINSLGILPLIYLLFFQPEPIFPRSKK